MPTLNFLRKGFTYLELMITIAIIGIIASSALYMYSSAQADSRDSRRKSDLSQLQLALEAYKADFNTYPASSLTGLTYYNYIETIPTDPSRYTYSYVGLDTETGLSTSCGTDCQSYRLMARLEETASACGNGFGTCNGSAGTCTYCLTPFGKQ
jgi:prepilin-type N-terminal cleavage/methylation domain-containing protein